MNTVHRWTRSWALAAALAAAFGTGPVLAQAFDHMPAAGLLQPQSFQEQQGSPVGRRGVEPFGAALGGGENYATRAELEEQAETQRIHLQRERHRAARDGLRRRVASAAGVVP